MAWRAATRWPWSCASGCATRSGRSPCRTSCSGRRACPRPARARSCGASCARFPRANTRAWATPRPWPTRRWCGNWWRSIGGCTAAEPGAGSPAPSAGWRPGKEMEYELVGRATRMLSFSPGPQDASASGHQPAAMTVPTIGFLVWPGTRAVTLALAEEALRVARHVHAEAAYDVRFFKVEEDGDDAPWRLPGEPWDERLEGMSRLFLVADEPPQAVAPPLAASLRLLARQGCALIGLSAGVYP